MGTRAKEEEEEEEEGRRRNHFAKLLPFHPLFYLPHSQKVYSLPRFAIFLSIWQMALHNCTIHPFGSKWWNYFQFACSAAVLSDVGSCRLTIPVSEKPRAFVVGWDTALGGGRAIYPHPLNCQQSVKTPVDSVIWPAGQDTRW